jgi:two-component system, LytTR family, sensor histidine kinase AlgZ
MPDLNFSSALKQSIIPDGHNLGVMLRSLLAANLFMLGTVFWRVSAWQAAINHGVVVAAIVEIVCLSALIVLGGVRALLGSRPHWVQQLVCAVVPAALTALLMQSLSKWGELGELGGSISLWKSTFIAAFAGWCWQHYFYLRAKAFSPAMAEARLQALQARIQPHFLFNSLNAVLSLVRSQPLQAEETLQDLADLFRVLMRDSREMATLEQEIRLCQQYLSIEKIRLGDRLQVLWKIEGLDAELRRTANVPSLLLQPLLENAVHYGVEPSTQPSLVIISGRRIGEVIELSVTNPVHHQVAHAFGNHMALENIRERLLLLYDVEARLTTTTQNQSFEVSLRFPYRKIKT